MQGKFIKQILVFASLWFAAIYLACLFLPFHYFNAEYPMWKSKMEILEGDTTAKNLIIGDSRAIAGIDVRSLGPTYYNLALGGGTPMEGYYMLKKMLANEKQVDTIIVSYAPIHFEQSEMFWDRQVKYGFYNLSDIDQIFEELNSDNEEFWLYDNADTYQRGDLSRLKAKAYLNHFKFPTTLRTELSKSFLLRGGSNYKVYQEIKEQRGSFEFGKDPVCHELNVEAKREQFRPKEILAKSLDRFFDLAKEKNITVIWLTMPMNKSSYSALSPEYRKGVIAFMETVEERHPHVRFMGKPIVSYEDTFFGDPSHLNQVGRQKFTKVLKDKLQSQFVNSDVVLTHLQFE